MSGESEDYSLQGANDTGTQNELPQTPTSGTRGPAHGWLAGSQEQSLLVSHWQWQGQSTESSEWSERVFKRQGYEKGTYLCPE